MAGKVTGNNYYGIKGYNSAAGASLTVITVGHVRIVTGDAYGIRADNLGSGPLSITADGDVAGGTAGIFAFSSGTPISITVGGTVQNASGEAFHLAIQATGAATALSNDGVTTGRMILSAFDDDVTNTNTWNTAGDSDFGAGFDELLNEGRIDASGWRTWRTPRGADLELLRKRWQQHRSSGGSGQRQPTSRTALIVSGNYEGEGGTLAVDAFLGGAGSVADVLTIEGNSSGTTFVAVNDTNPGFGTFNPDGILVVDTSAAQRGQRLCPDRWPNQQRPLCL